MKVIFDKSKKNSGYMELTNSAENSNAQLYIYGDICGSKWDKWTDDDKCPQDIADLLNSIDANSDVDVYINSGGGSVFGALAIVSQLSRHNGKKTAYVDGLASDILGRKDAEDTIVGFNSLVSDATIIDRFRSVLFIVDNSTNIAVSYKIVSLMEICNCKDKEQAIEAGRKFIEGDNKQFDALKKLYVLAFNQAFDHYKNTYNGYVEEIQKMDEWSNIDNDQKNKVLDELESIEIKGVVISQDFINATGSFKTFSAMSPFISSPFEDTG